MRRGVSCYIFTSIPDPFVSIWNSVTVKCVKIYMNFHWNTQDNGASDTNNRLHQIESPSGPEEINFEVFDQKFSSNLLSPPSSILLTKSSNSDRSQTCLRHYHSIRHSLLLGCQIKIAFWKPMTKVRLFYLNTVNKDAAKPNWHLNKDFLHFDEAKIQADNRTIDINSIQRIQFESVCVNSGKQLRMQICWINQQNVCNISFCMRANRVLNKIEWRWPDQCNIAQWVKP